MGNRNRALTHLRSNVVGYVALFVALGSGSAMAANTVLLVGHRQRRGQDRGHRRRRGRAHLISLTTPSPAPRSPTTTLGNVDLKAGSVRSSEVANESLGGNDITDGSLTGADVSDESLTGADITDGSIAAADTNGLARYRDVMWAVVNADGTVARASEPATGVAQGGGNYEVTFTGGRNLDGCASTAHITRTFFTEGAPGPGEASSGQGEAFEFDIDVRTFNSGGTPTDSPFTVYVLCDPDGSIAAAKARK